MARGLTGKKGKVHFETDSVDMVDEFSSVTRRLLRLAECQSRQREIV